MSRWVLYGATGYTGQLLVAEAKARGMTPVLAGRSKEKLAPLAERYGLEHVVAAIDDPAALRKAIDGAQVVLHVAGPFVDTSLPMLQACLDAKASYLDLTGELPVIQQSFAHDAQAMQRGIAVISAAGFDVVPTDCLAKHVADKTPGATELEIALAAIGSPSAGTAKSALGIWGLGAMKRRNGALVSGPIGRGARQQRFSTRQRWVVPMAIGDLETAWHTTGIPNISTWFAVGKRTAKLLGRTWPLQYALTPVIRAALGNATIEEKMRAFIDRRVQGPDQARREKNLSLLWAMARGPGQETQAWMETVDGYDYTKVIALKAVERVLKDKPVGALSPAMAFGKDFAFEVPGTKLIDSL